MLVWRRIEACRRLDVEGYEGPGVGLELRVSKFGQCWRLWHMRYCGNHL